MSFVVMVTGARGFDVAPELVTGVLTDLAPDFVIMGDCPSGVDLYAYLWCEANLPVGSYRVHFADWAKHGHQAGPRRNGAMVRDAAARADAGDDVLVVAFPRDGSGTKDCMQQAEAAGLHVEVF
jgi:hypothetical protein